MAGIERQINGENLPSSEAQTVTNRKFAIEEERRRTVWQQETNYLSLLLTAKPRFFEKYRYFLPPGTINAAINHYKTGGVSSIPTDFNVVRRLVKLDCEAAAAEKSVSFYHCHPIPGGTFLVTEDAAERFQDLWKQSHWVYLLGRVNRDFFAKKSPSRIHPEQFLNEQEQLYQTFRQKHPHLASLQRLNPLFLTILESHYFQGKPFELISKESGFKSDQANVMRALGLKALDIRQKLTGHTTRRWENWLEPTLSLWKGNEAYIASLQPNSQAVAWDLLRGQNARIVSVTHKMEFKHVQDLRHQLLHGVIEYEPFKQSRLQQAAEHILVTPIDNQPVTTLTLKILTAEAAGKTYRDIEKDLGLQNYQTRYVLEGAILDLQTAGLLPELTSPLLSFRGNVKFWQNTLVLYTIFVKKAADRGETLTPRQKQFITEQKTKQSFTFEDTRFLYLYLDTVQPRVERAKRRIHLAQNALEQNPAIFSSGDLENIEKIARGIPLERIMPRGIRNAKLRKLLEKLEHASINRPEEITQLLLH